MKLKNIIGYIVGDYKICVTDATNDEFNYIDSFTSSDKEKIKQYGDATLTNIIPHNSDCIGIEVCINYGVFTED